MDVILYDLEKESLSFFENIFNNNDGSPFYDYSYEVTQNSVLAIRGRVRSQGSARSQDRGINEFLISDISRLIHLRNGELYWPQAYQLSMEQLTSIRQLYSEPDLDSAIVDISYIRIQDIKLLSSEIIEGVLWHYIYLIPKNMDLDLMGGWIRDESLLEIVSASNRIAEGTTTHLEIPPFSPLVSTDPDNTLMEELTQIVIDEKERRADRITYYANGDYIRTRYFLDDPENTIQSETGTYTYDVNKRILQFEGETRLFSNAPSQSYRFSRQVGIYEDGVRVVLEETDSGWFSFTFSSLPYVDRTYQQRLQLHDDGSFDLYYEVEIMRSSNSNYRAIRHASGTGHLIDEVQAEHRPRVYPDRPWLSSCELSARLYGHQR
jgi:hypothetical protein